MKKDGFNNEKIFIISKEEIPANSDTFVTDIEYFPNVKYHFRERSHGSDEHILILCIAGKGFVNDDITVHSESLVIIPQKLKHKYGADAESPWDIF